ncbi:Mce-associated membrane protein [Mycolicibacterium iranicum]|uniref:Mce-associated membrane protein n=1 Tax=Mycolicibacterium iranicum TaxID=912594 RepID=A0A839QF84_MYCIR|nr:Mce protein [Mycolicibacterium iranicum]MBB2993165.1 Mce-associated membrane protein [Mycolicibacterium iranicum]
MADEPAAPDGELRRAGSSATDVEPEAVELTDVDDTTEVAAADPEADGDTDGDGDRDSDETEPAAVRRPMSHVKLALLAGLAGVVALAALTGWLGYRTYESQRAEQQRNSFLQAGRQGALNLTTINWESADTDVQRILDSATGTFYDDFQRRAEPFVQVVKQAQSKSVGTVAEAGLESSSDTEADVLVAVMVQTTNAGTPEQQPRRWRMRVTVQEVDGQAKVSNVEFVP